MKLRVGLVGAGAVGFLLLGGCSSSEEETQNANTAACQSLAEMKTTVTEVTESGASAASSGQTITVEQAQAGMDKIKSSYQEVKDSASDLSDSASKQFEGL